MNTIGLLLLSSQATAEEVARWALAVRGQLRNHVAPAWRIQAPTLVLYESLADVPEDVPLISIFDDTTHAGALGFHSETPDGRPFGRVFLNDAKLEGSEPSTVLSHEAVEIVLNPDLAIWVDDGTGRLWAREVADATQATAYQYRDVWLSNFVLPSYFDPRPEDGARFDYLGHLSAPFTLSPGGYSVVRSAGKLAEVRYSNYFARASSERTSQFSEASLLGQSKLHPAARTQRLLKQT